MTAQYFLPLATYPDSSSGLIISNAVAFAGYYGANLHACALRVGIPHIPNAWSSLLLDTPQMIEHAETLSRDRAATLVAAATNLAANAMVELSCRTVKTTLPLLHETVATEARFFDLAILECIADVPDTRIVAEAVIFRIRPASHHLSQQDPCGPNRPSGHRLGRKSSRRSGRQRCKPIHSQGQAGFGPLSDGRKAAAGDNRGASR
ncbi:hypothetical protein LZK75_12115 [Rhizobium leguminosarum]|nr:hypothetical protein LZK75_12115 [Rhizobium leguminosarum]